MSSDGLQWVLLNAAAELAAQLASFRPLHPPAGARASRLSAVVLTDAELDHTVGLLALRQASTLRVAGTATIRKLLECGGLLRLVSGYLTVEWQEIAVGVGFALDPRDPSWLQAVPFAVGAGKPPAYAGGGPVPADATVGLQITDSRTSGCVVYLPVLPLLTDAVREILRAASLILLDGTFFSEAELADMPGRRTARQLGHLPVGGPDGSMARLDPAIRSRVVYTHLNNTNPLLADQSPETAELHRSGAALAADGAVYEL